MKKLLITNLLLTLITISVQAQRYTPKIEDLPRIPIDTIKTSDPQTSIILFSNNTWEYFRPGIEKVSELPIYTQHWVTDQVFAYRSIELRDLPAEIELHLVDNLNEFHTPVQGKVYSKYGPRRRRAHNGVDIPLKMYEPIYAMFEGKVRYAKYNSGGFGNLIIVRHLNGLETWYAHLSRNNVKVGDYVKAGQVIGFSGNTGRSRGPHLHFEIRYKDQTFDPEFLIDFENGQLKYQTFMLEKKFFNIHSRASALLEEDEDLEFPLLSDDSAPVKAENAERASREIWHIVKSGDILSKIARRYGVTVNQICRLNNIKSTTTLRIGRRLRIK